MTVVIQQARAEDTVALPEIELLSGEVFRSIPGLEWIVDEEPTGADELLPYAEAGTLWIARYDDVIIGYLAAEKIGRDLHIWQVSVLPDRQKQGIGRALFGHVTDRMEALGIDRVTLTTFRYLAFNELFYASLGFVRLEGSDIPERLAQELQNEAAHGLPIERRCAMVWELD